MMIAGVSPSSVRFPRAWDDVRALGASQSMFSFHVFDRLGA